MFDANESQKDEDFVLPLFAIISMHYPS